MLKRIWVENRRSLRGLYALAAVCLIAVSATTALAAWIIFGEAIGLLQMAGGALLLWGIYLARRGS